MCHKDTVLAQFHTVKTKINTVALKAHINLQFVFMEEMFSIFSHLFELTFSSRAADYVVVISLSKF